MLATPTHSRPTRALLRAVAATLLVSLTLAAPSLASTKPAPAASATATAKPNFAAWQMLLDRYLMRLPPKSALQDTRFDYEQFYVDENIWTLRRSERLERIRAQLLSTPPSTLSPRDRRAWAINTYNFLVVEQASLNLLVPGRKFLRHGSVNEILINGVEFFRAPVLELEGKQWSIESFGRWYVYGDSTPATEPRTREADPRLAFALCRSYVGDAPLPPRAFRGDSLELQLDQAARRALAQQRFVSWDAAARSLVASELFNEVRVDFGGDPHRAVEFIERFGPLAVRAHIKKFKLDAVTRFSAVDPKMNQYERPKAAPPTAAPGTPGADT